MTSIDSAGTVFHSDLKSRKAMKSHRARAVRQLLVDLHNLAADGRINVTRRLS